MGQSTNDMFPTAIHVAVAVAIQTDLIPALEHCARGAGARRPPRGQDILKIGRTHLADATPLALGPGDRRPGPAIGAVGRAGPAGPAGRAGTAGRRHGRRHRHQHASRVRPPRGARCWPRETGIPFVEAANHFEANAQRDGLVECHGQLRTIAATLFNVANNIRWLGSGPRCGFYEVKLPDRQPGSSIMPGKVNPVMCESMMQVAARVMGNDQTIAFCGAAGGQFQLNIMMPVMGDTVLESVRLLASAAGPSPNCCLTDMEANAEACEAAVEKSLSLVTGLNPYIGYEQAAALAKEAFATGKTIRELCREKEHPARANNSTRPSIPGG